MQIAKIKDNAVEKIGEHTDLFPNVSSVSYTHLTLPTNIGV